MIMNMNTKSIFMTGGNFGVGYHSTIHIESVWGTVKLNIATVFNKILDIN